MVGMQRSEEGWMDVDRKVTGEHRYKENVTRKTRTGRKCARKERRKKDRRI